MENDKNYNKIIIDVESPVKDEIYWFLVKTLKGYSPRQIQGFFKDRQVYINNKPSNHKKILKGGDRIEIKLSSHSLPPPKPQDISLNIVYEDDDIIVLDKPSYIAVHPAPGSPDNTIVNALLFHTDKLSSNNGVQMQGLVHRLDKNTSGLMIVAKNNQVHEILSKRISERQVKRVYTALVYGIPENQKGIINAPIGLSKKPGTRYAISHSGGKPAKTIYHIIETFGFFSLLRLSLVTGRTHQIRLHLSHIGNPVVGDNDYCKFKPETVLKEFKNINPKGYKKILTIDRQMLHAAELQFNHPITNRLIHFKSSLPQDFLSLLEILRTI